MILNTFIAHSRNVIRGLCTSLPIQCPICNLFRVPWQKFAVPSQNHRSAKWLMNKFQMKVFQSYLILYRETVSILIDKGAQPNLMPIKVSNPKVFKVPCTKGLPTLLKLFKLSGLDTLNDVNTVSKNYWACRIWEERHVWSSPFMLQWTVFVDWQTRMVLGQNLPRWKRTPMEPSNQGNEISCRTQNPNTFLHKVHMLEAQLSSFGGKTQEAQESFIAAINAAKSSGFGK